MQQSKKWLIGVLGYALVGLFSAAQVLAAPQVGQAAPEFSAVASDGKTYTLSELRGQRVILEWTNHDCPFVRKHYGAGNMQALQQEAAAQDYLWLSVVTALPGKKGYVDADTANKLTSDRDASPAAVLFDETGAIAKAYGARVTPHMYIIDTDGTLLYAGGIDDKPTSDQADIATATNYVRQAMAELDAGQEVSVTAARPYGCAVRY